MASHTFIFARSFFIFILSVILTTLILVTGATDTSAQTSSGNVPLGWLLHPDGTLNLDSDYKGSVDPAGFSMSHQEDGTPVFVPQNGSQLTNDSWQAGFGYPGANGDVNAVVMDGSGNLYVGGLFTTVGGVSANRVAVWDGTSWSALGSGVNNEVRALALYGSTLYAGGSFSTADDNTANSIAMWDGNSWSALGSGMSRGGSTPYVLALSVDGSGNVYAAGWFDSAGGSAAKNIAMWNGSSWASLGTSPSDGADNIIYSSYWDGSKLYIGGNFTHVGPNLDVGYIGAWNGSSWERLGSGASPGVAFPGGVSAIVKDGAGVLYAGGNFTQVGAVSSYITANYIGKFSGGVWSAVGSGTNGPVSALQVDGSNNIYAGGGFSAPAGLVLVWNGAVWSGLGTGSSGVNSLVLDGSGNVYAGGGFNNTGGNPASKVARWNGGVWSALASGGMNLSVNALALDGSGNLYAGGAFTVAGATNANRVAMWDGTSWSALGSGMTDGQVYSLVCDSSGNLYAGGTFTVGGGSPADYIAKWNGASWSAMGNIFVPVLSLLVDGSDTLYAGTSFSGIWSVVRWTGASWANLPGISSSVLALTMDSSGNLYAGGSFTNRVAVWDGVSSWSALGIGISDGQVNALAFDSKDNLFAGGTFTVGGGSPAEYIAQWNGSAWSALGIGVNGPVKTLAVDNANNIYAGGSFSTAGGASASNIAKWGGGSWSVLGSGANNEVNSIMVNKGSGDLYAGGMFTTAGLKESRYIGWVTGVPTSSSSFLWNLFLPAILNNTQQ